MAAVADDLFPVGALDPQVRPGVAPRPRPNGGWGDPRDHALCLAEAEAGGGDL